MRLPRALFVPFLLSLLPLLAATVRSQQPAGVANDQAPPAPATGGQLALPRGTGNLSPGPEWVVVRGDDIAAESRPQDPAAEPGRTMLRAMLGQLHKDQRTAEHVLLHQPGKTPGTIRVVNAYPDATRATSDELLRAAESVRTAVLPTLESPGVTVSYRGHGDARLFPIGSLVLRFDLAHEATRWHKDIHVVPAGDHVQYFEVYYFGDDDDGALAIEALLRTFDGAKEAQMDPIVRNMLIGGLAGGLLGVIMAKRRQRRRQAA
ncbi:MAG: hypothetical protein IT455_11605 [Planctomycetes bacterium]|nr:hypothetical protein [Planctomycetota bacterium]